MTDVDVASSAAGDDQGRVRGVGASPSASPRAARARPRARGPRRGWSITPSGRSDRKPRGCSCCAARPRSCASPRWRCYAKSPRSRRRCDARAAVVVAGGAGASAHASPSPVSFARDAVQREGPGERNDASAASATATAPSMSSVVEQCASDMMLAALGGDGFGAGFGAAGDVGAHAATAAAPRARPPSPGTSTAARGARPSAFSHREPRR